MTIRSDVILRGLLKSPLAVSFAATLADPGGGAVGYRNFSTPFGSGAGNLYKRGLKIGGIYTAAAWDIAIFIGDSASLPTPIVNLGQEFFNKLVFQDGDGNFQTLNTADAGYSTGFLTNFFYGYWYWGDGMSPYWASGDAAEVKTIVVI